MARRVCRLMVQSIQAGYRAAIVSMITAPCVGIGALGLLLGIRNHYYHVFVKLPDGEAG